MKVLVVNHREVQQWLSMSECVDAMVGVFKMLNRGNAENPLRNLMWLPDKSGREHYRFVNEVIAFIEASSPFYTFRKPYHRFHYISHIEFQAFRFPFP